MPKAPWPFIADDDLGVYGEAFTFRGYPQGDV